MLTMQDVGIKEIEEFSKYIKEKIGIDYLSRNCAHLRLAIWEMMKKCGINDSNALLTQIRQRVDVFNDFLELVTTGETYFFRDIKQFEALESYVLPQLIKKKSIVFENQKDKQIKYRPKIRVLSCGCSTGEEPYSIAMVISENVNFDIFDVELFAFDINKAVIQKAQKGVYGNYSFRGAKPTYLNRYIEKKDNFYYVSESIKNRVKFHVTNIFNLEESPDIYGMFDIIFCKNINIYFDLRDTKRVINLLTNHLSNNGYLFIGSCESLLNISEKLEVGKYKEAYLYRFKEINKEINFFAENKKTDFTVSFLPQSLQMPVMKQELFSSEERIQIDNFSKYRDGVMAYSLKDFVRAEQELKAQLMHTPDHLATHIALAHVYADSNKISEAVVSCERAIALDNLCGDAYFILGIINQSQGLYSKAVYFFQRVLYCEGTNFLASYCLACVYQDLGEFEKTRKQIQFTIKLIENLGMEKATKIIAGYTASYILSICSDLLGGE